MLLYILRRYFKKKNNTQENTLHPEDDDSQIDASISLFSTYKGFVKNNYHRNYLFIGVGIEI